MFITTLTDCVKLESPFCIKKRKMDDERARYEEVKRPKNSKTYLNKASSQNGPNYQIGPSSWIKKEITTYMLKRLLVSTIVPQNQDAFFLNLNNCCFGRRRKKTQTDKLFHMHL